VTGTYYLGVSSYYNVSYDPNTPNSGSFGYSSGSYTLTVTETAAHDTLPTAIPLSFSNTQQAAASGALADNSQVDVYAITVQAGQRILVDVGAQSQGSSLYGVLRLFDG